MPIHVRPVLAADEAQWAALYADYRSFYRLKDDTDSVSTTWQWVSQGAHGLLGLVAAVGDADGTLVGLANLRRFARPSSASFGLYLDDLFTAPPARGTGVGTALLQEAAAVAAAEGATVVRWITAADNDTARLVYDNVATLTPWVTYDLTPAEN